MANGIENQNTSRKEESSVKFDYKEPPYQQESWDQFLVRKLREDRDGK